MGAYVEINTQALLANSVQIRQYSGTAKVIAVIKANAYGHGAAVIAKTLVNAVDGFAVANITEAILLRKSALTHQKIIVLQGFNDIGELKTAAAYHLSCVIHCEQQLSLLKSSVLAQPLAVWLKIETGMNRLGFSAALIPSVLSALKQCPAVAKNIVLMTHFANADAIEKTTTVAQYQLFNQITAAYHEEKSSANSAAILAWPATHYDWVRAGLMLYGISPLLNSSAKDFNLQAVMNFYAPVIAVKTLQKGESVGYGSTWTAEKESVLAVISAGYGDGYPREIQTGASVLINNQRLPLVGRVSMDMLTVDISESPTTAVGDTALLWGKHLPVEEVAHYAQTIAYTLVCGVTTRVKRIFI